ncbi:hypothetical protein CR513_27197, partial [Mucuna pruriens]
MNYYGLYKNHQSGTVGRIGRYSDGAVVACDRTCVAAQFNVAAVAVAIAAERSASFPSSYSTLAFSLFFFYLRSSFPVTCFLRRRAFSSDASSLTTSLLRPVVSSPTTTISFENRRHPAISVQGSAAPLRYLGLTTMIQINNVLHPYHASTHPKLVSLESLPSPTFALIYSNILAQYYLFTSRVVQFASLPLYVLDHAFLTWVYLLNRLPTFHSILTSLLRVFGCACFRRLRSYNKNEFQIYSIVPFSVTPKLMKVINVSHLIVNCSFLKMSFSLSNTSITYPPLFSCPYTYSSTFSSTISLTTSDPNPSPSPTLQNTTPSPNPAKMS